MIDAKRVAKYAISVVAYPAEVPTCIVIDKKHLARVRDAGRVEAHRLVEGLRELPSRKQGMRCGARCGTGDRKAWG